MPVPDLSIRPLATQADYLACTALQEATWGRGFRELVPPAMLMIAEKMGGVAAGAFVHARLVGFVYGLTGLRDGRLSHWSHMLAVTEDWRDRGVGQQLKRYQRERVLAHGVDHMLWTFDPLVARNAHLNLNRLGVRVIEYIREVYGDDPDSSTDAVIGTDRLVVRWDLKVDPPRDGVADREASGVRSTVGPPHGRTVISPDAPDCPNLPVVEIAIPSDIQSLKIAAPPEARAWRELTRRAFEHYLPRGYVVRGVRCAPGSKQSLYRLERRPS